MMNLLIVDDERHIVNYMASLADENCGNLVEIYKAYSGSGALAILAETKIDIILLDIQMPGMTGLELAENISKTWPNCRIIFLTAHDSFDYIYKTKELPNTSYLLKTESEQVILAALTGAVHDIEEEQAKKAMLDDAIMRNKYLSHMLIQNQLRLLYSGMPVSSIRSEINFAQTGSAFDMEAPVYLMYMNIRRQSFKDCRIPSNDQWMQYLHLTQYHSSGKFNCFLLHIDNENEDGLWFFQCRKDADFGVSNPAAFLKNMADNLASDFEKISHKRISLILYPECVSCADVHDVSYRLQYMLGQMDFSTFLPTVVTFREKSIESSRAMSDVEIPDAESLLREAGYCLMHSNRSDYDAILGKLLKICKDRHSMHNLSCIRIYQTLALDLLNYIDSYQLQEELSTHTAIYPLYYVNNFTDWDNAFRYLQACSDSVFQIIEKRRDRRNSSTIEKIQKYIQANLHEQLNLSAIASVVNYNETYVSRFFKLHTGMKVSDYILQERLAKARQMLSGTEQSVNAIAESCGFDSIHYFSYNFKKNVGMSPSDYRRNSRG